MVDTDAILVGGEDAVSSIRLDDEGRVEVKLTRLRKTISRGGDLVVDRSAEVVNTGRRVRVLPPAW
jgi:hypothetical protein